jgi:hypothetical protein
MKSNPESNLVRRLAGLFVRHLQLAAALGSWAYRAPYPWEFELVNARWPRPARSSPEVPPSPAARADRCLARLATAGGCACAAS